MIYVDIVKKAISAIPNVSVSSPTQEQSARQYDSSFKKDPIGVTGGSLEPDRSDVGQKWRGRAPTTADEEEAENEETEDQLRSEAELEASKSILKSVTSRLAEVSAPHRLNPREAQFLVEELGYAPSDLKKGYVAITHEQRVQFSAWLLNRMHSSVDRLCNE